MEDCQTNRRDNNHSSLEDRESNLIPRQLALKPPSQLRDPEHRTDKNGEGSNCETYPVSERQRCRALGTSEISLVKNPFQRPLCIAAAAGTSPFRVARRMKSSAQPRKTKSETT